MAGTSWPALTSGRRARGSDVELKFDWLEGSLMPMSGGSVTTGVHDLGTTTGYWRGVYANSLNPTSTANGIAIGTTTVANNSSTALEIAGTRAILFPRLSTTQRDNLTAVEGHVIYNSTATQYQAYENGSWIAMVGARIGLISRLRAVTASDTDVDVVNITASGRVKQIRVSAGGSTGATDPAAQTTFTVDGTAYSVLSHEFVTGSLVSFYAFDTGDTTGTFQSTSGSNMIDVFFRTSMRFAHNGKSTIGGTVGAWIIYERT